jgi:hypothetical protein
MKTKTLRSLVSLTVPLFASPAWAQTNDPAGEQGAGVIAWIFVGLIAGYLRPFQGQVRSGQIRGYLSPKDFGDSKAESGGQEISLPSAPRRGKVIDLMSALKDSLKSRGKRDGAKDSEDEDAQDDGAADGKDVRRAAGSSRHPQSRRRIRS